jgi:beta-N-acetylhexosaminidase
MVAHVTLPGLEPDANRVATTSPAIVTDLLKNQLGFQGIVVTDALDMAGLTRLYANNIGRAAVDAFKAGNDLLLIPSDLDASYRAMLDAVKSGEIPQPRLDASVLKLLEAKASLGLEKARLVDVEAIPKLVSQPSSTAAGQQVADDAVTLVRDNRKLLPLKSTGTVLSGLPYQRAEEVHNRVVAVIFSDDVRSDWGRTLARQLRLRVPDANVIYVDPRTADAMSDSILNAAHEAQAVIAAVFVIPTAGKMIQGPNGVTNSVTLADATGKLLENLLTHAGEKTAVLALGNPYLAADFPQIQNYLCTFSNVSVSEISAVKALFGEISIRGHLPVTIPNIAQRGLGIERQAAVPFGGSQHAQASVH